MYNTEIDTFLLVAECSSFSQAAKKLYISTAAVSQQIKLLEDQLDVHLFTRSKRGASLTTAGTEFVKQLTASKPSARKRQPSCATTAARSLSAPAI